MLFGNNARVCAGLCLLVSGQCFEGLGWPEGGQRKMNSEGQEDLAKGMKGAWFWKYCAG